MYNDLVIYLTVLKLALFFFSFCLSLTLLVALFFSTAVKPNKHFNLNLSLKFIQEKLIPIYISRLKLYHSDITLLTPKLYNKTFKHLTSHLEI